MGNSPAVRTTAGPVTPRHAAAREKWSRFPERATRLSLAKKRDKICGDTARSLFCATMRLTQLSGGEL